MKPNNEVSSPDSVNRRDERRPYNKQLNTVIEKNKILKKRKIKRKRGNKNNQLAEE